VRGLPHPQSLEEWADQLLPHPSVITYFPTVACTDVLRYGRHAACAVSVDTKGSHGITPFHADIAGLVLIVSRVHIQVQLRENKIWTRFLDVRAVLQHAH
jgi:hypothetical protein